MANNKAIFVFALAAVSAFGEIIPPNARINWDPGVRGGIPNRATIYTTLGTGSTAAQINSAIADCPSNQVVLLDAGTFNINARINMKSGVTLRGAGRTSTVLHTTSGFSGNSVIYFDNGYDYDWNNNTAYTLTNCVKGSTNIGTTAANGWSVGDVVLVDMLGQPTGNPPIENAGSLGTATWVGRASGARPIGQFVKILSKPTTTTATIDPPLYWSYANTPQAVEIDGWIRYAGLEDLTVENATGGVRDTVAVQGAENCWLKNVRLEGNYRYSVWGYGALWFTMQGCHMIGGVPISTDKSAAYDSSRSYPLFMGPHFTAGLITDNISEKLTSGFDFEGCASGNVVSYNFITNMWWKDTGDSPRRFGILMHGPHPFMNLVEGNWSSDRIRADEYWGTSSHFVVLRNRIVQTDRGADDVQSWTVDIERRNWYWSFVGNLLGGSPSVSENQYEHIDGESFTVYYESPGCIWKIGYKSLGGDSDLYDYAMMTNTMRWGNWSYRTNDSTSGSGIVWHTEGVYDTGDTTIPDSLYLTSKPESFGVLSWPPYDPAAPTNNSFTNIPAGYRAYYGTNPPSGEPTAPTITANNATGTNGQAFLYSITASESPTGYGATNLPTGLYVTNATGYIGGTPLSAAGQTNTVGLFATNATGAATPAVVTFSIQQSNRAPTIAITSPTSSATYATESATIDISGTAADADGNISGVAWSNNQGGSGAATGTTSWSKTGISLSEGENVLTVTVTDSYSQTGTDTLTVTYTPPAPPSGLTNTATATTFRAGSVYIR